MIQKNKKKGIKKKPTRIGRSVFLSRIAKSLGVLAAVLILSYLSLGYILDRSFIGRDLNEKMGKVLGTTTLTLKILGPPNKPVLTATPVCVNYTPYVNLSWTSDDQIDYFDLERNGDPLVAGITESTYQDALVNPLTSYTYTVTAFNSLGENTSDPVTATTLDCGTPPPQPPSQEPICTITKFQNINLSGFHGTPSGKERRPRFYGTTNMPGAEIDIVISGKTSVIAKTSANENGYWMWRPPDKLNFGLNKIEATAVDPNDPTRKKTASLDFRIENEGGGGGGGGKEENAPTTPTGETTPTTPSENVPPVTPPTEKIPSSKISVRVTNPDKIAYPGKNLSVETEIEIGDSTHPFDSDLKYSIVDENYDEVFQTSDRIHIDGTRTIEKNLNLPRLLKPGKYKVVVSFSQDGATFVAEDSFLLKEVPLVNLGGGVTITATQIMTNLFWVIFWLLILLIIFLILLEIEYWISKRAIIQITEETLRRKGLITRKKIR
jgi:hypothetical protein